MAVAKVVEVATSTEVLMTSLLPPLAAIFAAVQTLP
jgi:hypothetical protein